MAGWLGNAGVVSCWLATGNETEVTAAVTLPCVVKGVVRTGKTILCCCCPAWICTLGCCWMTGGVRATAAEAMEVVTTGLELAGIPGCCARMTAVNPVNFAGVFGAEWVALMYCCCCCCCCCCCGGGCCCCCWPPWPVVLVFRRRLANACGGRDIGFKTEGFEGLFFCRHSSHATT